MKQRGIFRWFTELIGSEIVIPYVSRISGRNNKNLGRGA